MIEALAITEQAGGSIVAIAAHPGARREGVLGVRNGALRVAVSAPPDRGKANAAIQAVLARAIGCKPAQVELISGATSRQKRFRIDGLAPDTLRLRLAAVLPESEPADEDNL